MREDLSDNNPAQINRNLHPIISRNTDRSKGGDGSIPEGGRDRFKRFSVNGGGPMIVKGFSVGFRAVPFVTRKSILRIRFVQGGHLLISGNFGNDGGGCDREGSGITIWKGALRDVQSGKRDVVD